MPAATHTPRRPWTKPKKPVDLNHLRHGRELLTGRPHRSDVAHRAGALTGVAPLVGTQHRLSVGW